MTSYSDPIQGHGYGAGLDEEVNALEQFYRAFNSADLALMRSNWLPTEEASMANPLGGIKRGWQEIESVYERIFYGPARVFVEFHDYRLYTTAECLLAVGRERGYVEIEGARLALAIRTSRVFRREAGQWRQLHHHGSMEDPDLLRQYQQAVMKK